MSEAQKDPEESPLSGTWPLWSPLYRLREHRNGYGFHIAVLFFVGVLGLAGYHSTLLFCNERGLTAWNPESTWDSAIPALPWTVYIYLTLYFYFPIPAFIADRSPRGCRELAILGQGMLLLFALSFSVFMLFPAEVTVRTQMEALMPSMTPLLESIFSVMYDIDRVWNSWPSLHVSESLLIVLFVQRWLEIRAEEFPRRKLWMSAFWIAWILLSVSIITTKQHFIWDMITGGLLGWALWKLYILPRLDQRIRTERRASLATTA
jgi:membrane-associated phospholipid phosphatase